MYSLAQSSRKRLSICAFALTAVLLVSARETQATDYLLTDGNSTATVDPNSQAGMHQWTVNGVNQLAQQWFWFRTASAGPGQHSIDSISAPAITPVGNNYLASTYTAAGQYDVTIEYHLQGGSFGHSDITENITIDNLSAAPINFTFFQFSNFNLNNMPSGDNISISGSPNPPDGGFFNATQTKPGFGISETITTPFANHTEAADKSTTDTVNRLNTIPGLTLNDNTSAGPGDVTWAYQWDMTIAAGDSASIFKDKSLVMQVVPEPSTIALGAVGLAALLLRRRTRV